MARCELCKIEANSSHLNGNTHYASLQRKKAKEQGYQIVNVRHATLKKIVEEGRGKELVHAYWNSGGIGRRGYFSSRLLLPKKIKNIPAFLAARRAAWRAEAIRSAKRARRIQRREARLFAQRNARTLRTLTQLGISVPPEIAPKVEQATGLLVQSPEGQPQQSIKVAPEIYLVRDDKGYFVRDHVLPSLGLQGDLDRLIPRERQNSSPEVAHLWQRQGEFHFFPAIVEPEGIWVELIDIALVEGSRHRVTGWVCLMRTAIIAIRNAIVSAPDHHCVKVGQAHYTYTAGTFAAD